MTSGPGHRLVVGLDGGPSGADALAFARRWAAATGSAPVVVVVHPGPAPAGVQRVDAEWAGYEREAAIAVLADAERALDGVPGARFERLDADSAAHALADLAEAGDVLLVLGSRPRGPVRRTYPGSTAHRLLSGSASTVVVVPWGYADLPPDPPARVTVAFVDTDDGRHALAEGARLAGQAGARLDVLSVVPQTRVTPAMGEPSRYADALREDYGAAARAAALAWAGGGLEVTSRVAEGGVVEVLTDLGPADTDLLVCGSRGYGPVRRVLLGGVSHQVVRQARVPVAVVPRAGRPREA